MRRKILDMLWQWKKTENGRIALLIEGAWQTRACSSPMPSTRRLSWERNYTRFATEIYAE